MSRSPKAADLRERVSRIRSGLAMGIEPYRLCAQVQVPRELVTQVQADGPAVLPNVSHGNAGSSMPAAYQQTVRRWLLDGESFSAIARTLGITREMVRTIADYLGMESPYVSTTPVAGVEPAPLKVCGECGRPVTRALERTLWDTEARAL